MLVNSHVQTTAELWPNNQLLKDSLSLPLSLSLQPFANFHPESSISPNKIHEYRCTSCSAFLNQLCCILSDYQYECSLCGCINRMPDPIDITIPQLNNMSYQLHAPSKQRLLISDQRLVIVVLDLSFYGKESQQYLLYSLQVLKQLVKDVCWNKIPLRLMLIGFDSALHRFIINPASGAKCMHIISNQSIVEEDYQYLARYEELIGNIQSCRVNIEEALTSLEKDIITNQLRYGKSLAIMEAIHFSLRASQPYSGQILIVSGLRQQVQQFQQNLKKEAYDLNQQRHNLAINKKQCINEQLDSLLKNTQMSLSISFINQNYINNMPFLYITKYTNGQLRHYFPNQMTLFFHQFKQSIQVMLQDGTAYQSLLRVRYSKGLKLASIFGAYRNTKIIDQIQMLTCPETRRYLFQFTVEDNIEDEFVIIQFASLFTDINSGRYFLIQTYLNRVSNDPLSIISSIDYTNVNFYYALGVIHTLDTVSNPRALQLALQQRCKKHIKTLLQYSFKLKQSQTNEQINQSTFFRKAKSYIILTFLMIKHFLLNQNYYSIIHFDLNAEGRSKMVTLEDSLHIVWPVTYAVSQSEYEIIELKKKNNTRTTVAFFIDCCDQYYVHLTDPQLQIKLKVINSKQIILQMIQNEQSLSQLKKLIEQVKNRKQVSYIEILPLQHLNQMKIFPTEGPYGLDRFITELFRA